jgi:hypothetical protein
MVDPAGVGVSYVMPVLNEEHYVADAVGAILDQDHQGPVEVILALGPSTDRTDEVVARLAQSDPRLIVVRNEQGSIPAGVNAAIARASHPVVVRIDAHSEPGEGYTRMGVETLLTRGAAVVGGVMAAKGRAPVQRAIAWAYGSRIGIGGPAYHVGGEEGPAESAYLGIYRREWLDRVGGYDEGVGRGEDWDLCQRIIGAGGVVWFDPRLSVTYWPRESIEALGRQFFSTGVWRGHITRMDRHDTPLRYYAPPVAVLGLALGAALGLSGRRIGWAVPVAYAALVVGAAASARDLPVESRLAVLAVLPTMHLAWGAGFLRGAAMGAHGTADTSRTRDRSGS